VHMPVLHKEDCMLVRKRMTPNPVIIEPQAMLHSRHLFYQTGERPKSIVISSLAVHLSIFLALGCSWPIIGCGW